MTNPSIFQVELDGRALPVTLRVPGTPFAVHFAVDWSVSIQRDGVKDERLTALLLRRHGLKKVTRDLLCQIGSELGAIGRGFVTLCLPCSPLAPDHQERRHVAC